MTVYTEETVSISIPCVQVSESMNYSRHAMMSAEATAPDRGLNIHVNLVGDEPRRDEETGRKL